jgi:hypothetical protein
MNSATHQKRLLQWTAGEVLDRFDLRYSVSSKVDDYWISPPNEEIPLERIEELRLNLLANVSFWNEEELKIYFIGQLIDLVRYQQTGARGFFEREISADVRNVPIRLNTDFMIARGIDVPKAPYFCLQEYKKEKKSANDPEAQMLLAMLAAQELNREWKDTLETSNDDLPEQIYGTFIVGSRWRFTSLCGSEYHVSTPFEATQQGQVQEIFRILLVVKSWITKQVQRDTQKKR